MDHKVDRLTGSCVGDLTSMFSEGKLTAFAHHLSYRQNGELYLHVIEGDLHCLAIGIGTDIESAKVLQPMASCSSGA